jgi:hypothetical protein
VGRSLAPTFLSRQGAGLKAGATSNALAGYFVHITLANRIAWLSPRIVTDHVRELKDRRLVRTFRTSSFF